MNTHGRTTTMISLFKRPLIAALLIAFPLLAQAGEPSDQIRQTTEKILAIVQDPAMKGADKDVERQKRMKQVVDERFDWAVMARSAIGKHWRDLTEPQRVEFTSLFGEMIEQNYMSRVESYSGEKIQYKGDKVDGAFGVADVVIVTLKGTDIPVSYRVQKKDSGWLVYDVNIEGVSLVNNYRSQIGSILNNSTYEKMIEKIRANIAANASGAKKAKTGAAKPDKPAEDKL